MISGRPEYDFVSVDGVGHHFWLVEDNMDIERITEIFAEIPALFILPDGHHRSAAAALVGARRG